jgi:hypothetical protein
MRPLSDSELLDLWERGHLCHLLDRALLALAAVFPEVPYELLADWPIGRRNQSLARLRSLCFGSRLRGWLACAQCGEKLEFEMNAELLAGDGTNPGTTSNEPIIINGRTFRLPSSRDLARAASAIDPGSGAVRIAESCLLGPSRPAEWSEDELSEIGAKLALADPMAEIQVALHCPACGNERERPLDIVSFFWAELESRVRQILVAVHTLASAYGWSEADIFSLSDHRRALYLEMAGS